MEEVLTWLFNDGSSSVIGADAESMSVVSLQVSRQETKGLDHHAHTPIPHVAVSLLHEVAQSMQALTSQQASRFGRHFHRSFM